MHAGSRICLGKLRMSTCKGPAEDRVTLFRSRHQKRHASRRATATCASGCAEGASRVRRPCNRCKVPPTSFSTRIHHGVLLNLRHGPLLRLQVVFPAGLGTGKNFGINPFIDQLFTDIPHSRVLDLL